MNLRTLLITGSIVILTIFTNLILFKNEQTSNDVTSTTPIRASVQNAAKREMLGSEAELLEEASKGRSKQTEPEPRPFDVVTTDGHFSWTGEDGKSDKNLDLIANNPEHRKTLLYDNKRLKRRQLVYVDNAFLEQTSQIFAQGQETVKLPLFDGKSIEVNLSQVKAVAPQEYGDETGYLRGTASDDSESKIKASTFKNFWNVHIKHQGRQYEIQNRNLNEWIVAEVDLDNPVHHSCDHVSPDLGTISLSPNN